MVLNIVATVLVLALTFLHSMFGLFSGIINIFCTITAMCVAFGCAEPLNNLVTSKFHLHSNYTEPFALIVPFVLTLTLLRFLGDNFIRGNVRVHRWLDWIGGGVAGFFSAQIVVGTMVLGFLLLPWGGRTMMFERMHRNEDDEMVQSGLLLGSDKFTCALFEYLSAGSLRGSTTFASVYPDYPMWVWWTGNQIQPESLTAPIRDKNNDGFEEGLAVESWWIQKTGIDKEALRVRKATPNHETPEPPYEPQAFAPEDGKKLLGVRLKLRGPAADRGRKETDYPGHRFRPTNIRIVGNVDPNDAATPTDYVPVIVGGADNRIPAYRIVKDEEDTNFSLPGGDRVVDVIFEVDDTFEPRFVEYRRHARAELTGEPNAAPPPRLTLDDPGKKPGDPQGRGSGVARFIDTVKRAGEIELPMKLAGDKLRGELDLEFREGRILSGRISGSQQRIGAEAGARETIDRFAPPEGMKVFQIEMATRKMESLAGQVMNFAASTTNQYRAYDKQGTEYKLAGYYALVKRDNADFIELFYAPDPDAAGYNGLLDFKDSDIRKQLREQDDATLGLIFIVPPNACIVSIKSQGGEVKEFEYCVGG